MKALTKTIFKALCLLKKSSSHLPQPLEKFTPLDVEKVLVVSCTAIGDTLFATPAIRAVRNILPEAQIHLLVRHKFIDLFSNNPFIDTAIGYKGGYRGAFKLLAQIKRHGYSLCLVFHDSDPCPVQIAFLAGIPFIFRIGQRDEMVRQYLSCRVPYDQQKHAIDQRLEVVRRVFRVKLDAREDLRMDLPVNHQQSERLWQELMAGLQLPHDGVKKIGLQFSASGEYKRWPAENFVQLASRLLQASNKNVICLIGSPKEKKEAHRIIKAITQKNGKPNRILNLAGAIELNRFAEMIHGLDLLISNDTGPLHVAIAVGTPTVSLFVPSNYQATGPCQDLDKHKVVSRQRPCRPCTEKYCTDPYCMSLIPVDEVFESAQELLEAHRPRQNTVVQVESAT